MFRYCETKQFGQKIVIPLPLLWKKIFHTRVFSFFSNTGLPSENFCYCEKKSNLKSWSPILCIKLFDNGNFLKHRTVPLSLFSVPWDKINLLEIVLPAPCSYPQRFSIHETSDTLKGSQTKIFSTVRWKSFDGKTLYSLPPQAHLLIHKIFRHQIISETQKGSPRKLSGTLRQKLFDRKLWYSILMHKFFR